MRILKARGIALRGSWGGYNLFGPSVRSSQIRPQLEVADNLVEHTDYFAYCTYQASHYDIVILNSPSIQLPFPVVLFVSFCHASPS